MHAPCVHLVCFIYAAMAAVALVALAIVCPCPFRYVLVVRATPAVLLVLAADPLRLFLECTLLIHQLLHELALFVRPRLARLSLSFPLQPHALLLLLQLALCLRCKALLLRHQLQAHSLQLLQHLALVRARLRQLGSLSLQPQTLLHHQRLVLGVVLVMAVGVLVTGLRMVVISVVGMMSAVNMCVRAMVVPVVVRLLYSVLGFQRISLLSQRLGLVHEGAVLHRHLVHQHTLLLGPLRALRLLQLQSLPPLRRHPLPLRPHRLRLRSHAFDVRALLLDLHLHILPPGRQRIHLLVDLLVNAFHIVVVRVRVR
mmetsp:Transcript_20895/g.39711  ORF Transcript_20895/g.39711 Transcript_20895/m.39711 type:complete len:313 (-) Transcript_20895:2472-3410(-)